MYLPSITLFLYLVPLAMILVDYEGFGESIDDTLDDLKAPEFLREAGIRDSIVLLMALFWPILMLVAVGFELADRRK